MGMIYARQPKRRSLSGTTKHLQNNTTHEPLRMNLKLHWWPIGKWNDSQGPSLPQWEGERLQTGPPSQQKQ